VSRSEGRAAEEICHPLTPIRLNCASSARGAEWSPLRRLRSRRCRSHFSSCSDYVQLVFTGKIDVAMLEGSSGLARLRSSLSAGRPRRLQLSAASLPLETSARTRRGRSRLRLDEDLCRFICPHCSAFDADDGPGALPRWPGVYPFETPCSPSRTVSCSSRSRTDSLLGDDRSRSNWPNHAEGGGPAGPPRNLGVYERLCLEVPVRLFLA